MNEKSKQRATNISFIAMIAYTVCLFALLVVFFYEKPANVNASELKDCQFTCDDGIIGGGTYIRARMNARERKIYVRMTHLSSTADTSNKTESYSVSLTRNQYRKVRAIIDDRNKTEDEYINALKNRILCYAVKDFCKGDVKKAEYWMNDYYVKAVSEAMDQISCE